MTRGWTPLMSAIVDGDRTVAVADVDSIAEGAVSALSLACERGDADWIERLLAAGADPHVRAAGDCSLLHLVAPHGVALVERVLAAGVRVDFDGEGASPLEAGDLAVLARLLREPLPHGAAERAFGAAAVRDDLAAMRMIRAQHGDGVLGRVLCGAAEANAVAAIEYLLDAGATMDFDLKEEKSPLMHAAAAGALDAARVLIARGADVNVQTEWWVTALSLAVRRGDAAMVELLRANGAKTRDGEPIHIVMPYATYSNIVEPVRASRPPPTNAYEACLQPDPWPLADLLAAGASPHPQDWRDPMMTCVLRGRAAHIALLLAHGAKVKDDTRKWAHEFGYVRCAQLLDAAR